MTQIFARFVQVLKKKDIIFQLLKKIQRSIFLCSRPLHQEINYQIVGPYEANLELKLISTASPIAKALIGKEEGASVVVSTPGGTKHYEILSIEVIPT